MTTLLVSAPYQVSENDLASTLAVLGSDLQDLLVLQDVLGVLAGVGASGRAEGRVALNHDILGLAELYQWLLVQHHVALDLEKFSSF